MTLNAQHKGPERAQSGDAWNRGRARSLARVEAKLVRYGWRRTPPGNSGLKGRLTGTESMLQAGQRAGNLPEAAPYKM